VDAGPSSHKCWKRENIENFVASYIFVYALVSLRGFLRLATAFYSMF